MVTLVLEGEDCGVKGLVEQDCRTAEDAREGHDDVKSLPV